MFAIAAAVIGAAKGRSGVGWFILGLPFGIFAVIIVACLPSLKQQAFAMQNPDGTATLIQPVQAPQRPRKPLSATAVLVWGVLIMIAVAWALSRSMLNTAAMGG